MMRRVLLPLLLVLLAACASTGSVRAPVSPRDALASELAAMNDEELFACGSAAWQARDYERAAACFSTLAERFPTSRHWHHAMFNAGAAFEALERWDLALDRYLPLVQGAPRPDEDLEPRWRAATCLYHLDRYEEAIALLEPITDAAFRPGDRIRATTHQGICRLEMGQLGPAEIELRRALEIWKQEEARADERIPDYWPGQAQFFIGEVYRLHFEAVELQAVDDLDKLAADLEYKAQLLLSAQGHYLRAIRVGNAHWGTAAGQRIGGLYETLYDQMMHAPVPPEMDEHQASLYRGLLRRRVRVLVQKAIAVYERTLSTAERIGVRSGFVEQTQASLDRMKEVLLADAARDEAEGIRDTDLEPAEEKEGAPSAPADRAEAPGA